MSLRKIRTVAASEFVHLVRTKVFLLSLVLVPLFSLGLGFMSGFLFQGPDLKIRRFAVLDRSGLIYASIEQEASADTGAHFVAIALAPAGRSAAEIRDAALAQVRRGELFAYLEIPPDAVDPLPGRDQALRYYSIAPAYAALPAWLDKVVNREIRRRRFQEKGVDAAGMRAVEQDVPLGTYAVAQDAGSVPVKPLGPEDAAVPAGSMLLLFMMVMLTAPQMMSSVIEEKMSRISEVLLASVTPFDLMVGKLVACCGASGLVGALYLAAAYGLAAHYGYSGLISARTIYTFPVFLVLAVFLHGSLYMAVGSACSQPRDAQGMLAPLVLVTAVPLAAIASLLQDPSGALPTFLSYFPLSAPFVLCFRFNSPVRPSSGAMAGAISATLLATLLCVWAASRIFRIGLLSQGKAPGFLQLCRWIWAD